jgi:hypothetical protein|tara:strand:+ start:1042 stop:1218 length:177 start_codon:yes stop_codon:yes gene_type:complete
MSKTATLDKVIWVEIVEMDIERGLAYVSDEDANVQQVSIERLDNIQEPLADLAPLELI